MELPGPWVIEGVDKLHGANNFQPYVARFQKGPFRLDLKMANELADRFARFPKLA